MPADWVRDCNAATHPERSANGHASARPIRYWQIGNETSYDKARFNKPEAIAQTIAFARAMRGVDPTIKLIAWGDSGWAQDMIGEAGELIDMLAFHHLFDPGPACGDEAYKHDPAAAWETLMASVGTQEAKRSEEHTSELQSPMRNSYAVFCLKKKHRTLMHNYAVV